MKSDKSARAAPNQPATGPRDRSIALEPTLARPMTEVEIDAVLADSFPASDPPAWTLGIPHKVSSGYHLNIKA